MDLSLRAKKERKKKRYDEKRGGVCVCERDPLLSSPLSSLPLSSSLSSLPLSSPLSSLSPLVSSLLSFPFRIVPSPPLSSPLLCCRVVLCAAIDSSCRYITFRVETSQNAWVKFVSKDASEADKSKRPVLFFHPSKCFMHVRTSTLPSHVC